MAEPDGASAVTQRDSSGESSTSFPNHEVHETETCFGLNDDRNPSTGWSCAATALSQEANGKIGGHRICRARVPSVPSGMCAFTRGACH